MINHLFSIGWISVVNGQPQSDSTTPPFGHPFFKKGNYASPHLFYQFLLTALLP